MQKIDAHFHYNTSDPGYIEYAAKLNFKLISINIDAGVSIDEQLEITSSMKKLFPDEFAFFGTFSVDSFGTDSFTQQTIDRIDRRYFEAHPQYHMYLQPEAPSYQTQIDARDNLLKQYPGIDFTGAHLASLEWSVDELSQRYESYPEMNADLTDRIGHLQYQSLKDREKILRHFSLKYIVYTMGSSGSIIKNAEESSYTKVPKEQVADTVGAGDAFTAIFIAGILKGIPLTETHRKATEFAAYVCTGKGATPGLTHNIF
ncbi:MAG: PfkB family carbohydrate kinase [Bacteroidales bacterium]|jgi:hypothetical protein|nr:PfkB family carbohydrate kinase [Bacteroidales bacterium]